MGSNQPGRVRIPTFLQFKHEAGIGAGKGLTYGCPSPIGFDSRRLTKQTNNRRWHFLTMDTNLRTAKAEILRADRRKPSRR